MRHQTARRLATLELSQQGPVKYHVIYREPGTAAEAAIDLFGRDRIGPDDHIIFIPCPRTDLDD